MFRCGVVTETNLELPEKEACLLWRIFLQWCRTVAPRTATVAYAARWRSPSESWCRTSRRCQKRRDCPLRGLSLVPRKRTVGWSVLQHLFRLSFLFPSGLTHSLSHRKLMRVCRYLVRVQSGGHHCDKVLEHLVVCDGSEREETMNVINCLSGCVSKTLGCQSWF